MPDEELADAKRAIVGSFALALENPQQMLGYYIDNWQYGLPADYWDTYPARMTAVTAGAGAGRGAEVLGARPAPDRRRRRRHEDHRHPEEEGGLEIYDTEGNPAK